MLTHGDLGHLERILRIRGLRQRGTLIGLPLQQAAILGRPQITTGSSYSIRCRLLVGFDGELLGVSIREDLH